MKLDQLSASILHAMPLPILVVDDDVSILWYNQAAAQVVGAEAVLVLRRRAGEVLHCLHAQETPEGCGRAAACRDCPVRGAVGQALQGQKVIRQRAKMELVHGNIVTPVHLLVTTAPFTFQGKAWALLVLEDISELMELKGLLPICSYCKSIRDDEHYWQSVEHYFKAHLDLDFSHGICPDCLKKILLTH